MELFKLINLILNQNEPNAKKGPLQTTKSDLKRAQWSEWGKKPFWYKIHKW
jgi:hypothetical protein